MSLEYAQMPATSCIVVMMQGWTFVVDIWLRRQTQRQIWCKTLAQLTQLVQDHQLLGSCPVYLRESTAYQFIPLSYDKAAELYHAALNE